MSVAASPAPAPPAAPPRAGRAFAAALSALTLGALALRLWRLDALGGFDWDEVATVYIAARPLPDLLAYLRGAPFEHPPLYYLLAHAWLRLGDSEAVLRALSALLGALTVPVVGLLGATLFDRRVGLGAAALLAGAPAHVFYSRDARMYPLLTLLLTLGLYALVRARAARRGAAGWWGLWGAAALLALATHYYAAFAVGGQALGALRAGRVGRATLLALAFTGGLGAAAVALWWALAPGLRHSLGGLQPLGLSAEEAAGSLWRATAGLLRGPFSEEPPLWEEAAGALALGLLTAAAVAAWRERREGVRWLVWSGLAPLLGLVALMLLGRDLNVRFLLMLLPVALLALAAGGSVVRPRWRLPAAGAWAVVGLLWLAPYYASYVRGDYALALREIEAAEQPGEAVVFNGPWQTLLFDHYYRGRLPAHVLTGEVPLVEHQVDAALAALAARYQALWLLETDMGHADPAGFVPRWLGSHAYRERVQSYRQVRLARYLLAGPPLRALPITQEFGAVSLEAARVELGGPRPGAATRVELGWRVTAEFDPGLKVSVRLATPDGARWWAADLWLEEGWLGSAAPRPGDVLFTRLAATLPPEAPAGPYALELVVYRSSESAVSGTGQVLWSAPPLRLPLDEPGGVQVAVAPSGAE